MKVKLTKLKEAENPLHPNNIETGFEKIGDVPDNYLPVVGDEYWIGYWRTSTIQEVYPDGTFRTYNSIYKVESLDVE